LQERSIEFLNQERFWEIPFGDTRTRKHFVPLTHYVLLVFPGAGFVLKEEVVKIQIK